MNRTVQQKILNLLAVFVSLEAQCAVILPL